MNRPDLKQLIAGFLLIAAAMSSSALFFSFQKPTGSAGDLVGAQNSEQPSVPTNAFVELPDRTKQPSSTLTAVPGIFPENAAVSDNLTDGLVALLGEKIADNNPTGPTNPDGTLNLSDLDANELADYFAQHAGQAADIPDWEGEINAQHITVLTKYTTEDINTYNKQINSLLELYALQTSRLKDSGTPTSLDLGGVSFSAVHQQGLKLVVPESVAGFHWSLMKLIAYQQKALETAKLAETDPVRASLILRGQEPNFLAALQLLVNESQRKTDIRGISLQKENEFVAMIQRIIGIQTAHAQWLVVDPVDEGRSVWEWVQKIATELLKDRLVHKLVQQTIKWIQGGGSPQFVTNFKGFMTGVAEDEAGRMIDRFAPRLCQSFGPLVSVAVIPVDYSKDFDAGPTCTLDQVVGNVRAFAESFENGGWVAYGAAMQPSNNFFGAMIQMSDIVDIESEKKAEATKSDVESSHGFLSSKECIESVSEYDQCVESLTGQDIAAGLKCSNQMSKEKNICVKYRNTTPGETLVGAIKDSGAAPLLRIVNADDLVALANALINAALSKLVKLGASTISKGILGLDMGTYEDSPDKCAGLTGEQLTACQSQWQEVTCTPKNISAPVNVTVTGSAQIPGTPGTGGTGGADCSSCGGMSGTCCGSAADCPGLNFYGIPSGDCPNGCYGPGSPPNCSGTPGTPGTPGGSAPVSGTGTGSITFPNGADCTGGGTGGGSSGGSCDGENCGSDDCLCKVRDQISQSDFCFLGDIQNAINAAIDDWKGHSPNGEQDPATGIVGAPFGGCQGSYTRPCVYDVAAFHGAVLAHLSGGQEVGEEICVTGPSCKSTCSYGSPTDCRTGLQHAAGDACTAATRRECSKIEASNNTIMFNNANSICPG
ncbi:MAG: hypothetical protein RL681_449 [Candidatus Parcubacteria bacterium]|jgi:hypothetical protein